MENKEYTCPKGHKLNDDVPYCMICGESFPVKPKLNRAELKEKIEQAWWKLDTTTAFGKKMIPSPKEHKNLLGDKEKYILAVLALIPDIEETNKRINQLERHLVLTKAESDGYGSELLQIQKDCIEVKKEAEILRIGSLTLLVAEIQTCKDMAEVNKILESWIKANNLEPEKVETYSSIEELKQALKNKEEDNVK